MPKSDRVGTGRTFPAGALALGWVISSVSLGSVSSLPAGPPEAGTNVGGNDAPAPGATAPGATPGLSRQERRYVSLLGADAGPTIVRSFISVPPGDGAPADGDGGEDEPRRDDGRETTVPGGEGLVLFCVLENSSNESVSLTIISPVGKFIKVQVRRTDGEPVALTAYGEDFVETGLVVSSRRTRRVEPGQSFEHPLHLSRMYDLSAPGEYEVSYSLLVPALNRKEPSISVPTKFRVPE